MDGNLLIAAISLMAVLASNAIWLINNYVGGRLKSYAAERDFNHLKNNQLQLSQGIRDSHQDLENLLSNISRDILEIKVSLGLKKD